MRYVSLDIETTGLDPEVHQVIEFAAVLDDVEESPDLDQLPWFQAYIDHNPIVGAPFALHMNARVIEKLARPTDHDRVITPDQLPCMFRTWLEKHGITTEGPGPLKFNVAGKNAAGFDLPFLRKLPCWDELLRANARVLDPAILYYQEDDETLPSTNTCLRRAGIDSETTHEALQDALDVVKLIRARI